MSNVNSRTIDKILEVHNINSSLNAYYDILSPIQITLEYCRGLSSEDFINILMLSPEGTYFHQICNKLQQHQVNVFMPHQHNFFELLIVLEGEMIQQIENNEYIYHTGSCCLINRNVIHCEKFASEAKVLFIGLSLNFITDLIQSGTKKYFPIQEQIPENAIFKFMESNLSDQKAKEYLDFLPAFKNVKGIHELHKLTDLLIQTMLFPKLGTTYMLKGIICELFDYLNNENLYHFTPIKLTSNMDFLLFSHISHLLEDTCGRATRSELERYLNYSGNYINSIVKKYTGMCLFDYGMTFCLKKAEQLLATTDEPISEIVKQLKFSNRSHFYNLFKETYGITPGDYRKKYNSTIT